MASRFSAFVLALFILVGSGVRVEARWLRAETPLFVVYSDGSEAKLRAFVQGLHEFDVVLQKVTRFPGEHSPNKLTIYLVRRQEDLRQIAPSVPREVAGFYVPSHNGIFLTATTEELGPDDWATAQSLIFHEYTHHFTFQYGGSALYPGWLVEGLAEYFGPTKFEGDTVTLGGYLGMRAAELFSETWVPIDKVINPAPGTKRPDRFHAESWLAVHYLMQTAERRNQIGAYLRILGSKTGEPAFQEAFGMDFAAFDRALRSYKAEKAIGIFKMPRPVEAKAVSIEVTALPPSADKLLLKHARVIRGVTRAEADAFVKSVRREAAAFPNDPFALRVLGFVEADYGEPDNADAPLDRALAINPEDVEAMYLKVNRYVMGEVRQPERRAELWKQARTFAGEVNKRDPNHFQTLSMYAAIRMAESEVPSQNTIDVFLRASALAPQVTQISVQTALALLRAKKTAEAKVVLQRFANAPHLTRLSETAREFIARIDAGDEISEAEIAKAFGPREN